MSTTPGQLELMASKCAFEGNRAVLSYMASLQHAWDADALMTNDLASERDLGEQSGGLDEKALEAKGEQMQFEGGGTSVGVAAAEAGQRPWKMMQELEGEFRGIAARFDEAEEELTMIGSDDSLADDEAWCEEGTDPQKKVSRARSDAGKCKWQSEAETLEVKLAEANELVDRAVRDKIKMLRQYHRVEEEMVELRERLRGYESLAGDVEAFTRRYSTCFSLLWETRRLETDRAVRTGSWRQGASAEHRKGATAGGSHVRRVSVADAGVRSTEEGVLLRRRALTVVPAAGVDEASLRASGASDEGRSGKRRLDGAQAEARIASLEETVRELSERLEQALNRNVALEAWKKKVKERYAAATRRQTTRREALMQMSSAHTNRR